MGEGGRKVGMENTVKINKQNSNDIISLATIVPLIAYIIIFIIIINFNQLFDDFSDKEAKFFIFGPSLFLSVVFLIALEHTSINKYILCTCLILTSSMTSSVFISQINIVDFYTIYTVSSILICIMFIVSHFLTINIIHYACFVAISYFLLHCISSVFDQFQYITYFISFTVLHVIYIYSKISLNLSSKFLDEGAHNASKIIFILSSFPGWPFIIIASVLPILFGISFIWDLFGKNDAN